MHYIPQNGKRNKLGNEEIKRRIKQKTGHWEILYPDIDDINKLSIKVDIKCLDCGKERTVGLSSWLSPKNLKRGCPYCEQ